MSRDDLVNANFWRPGPVQGQQAGGEAGSGGEEKSDIETRRYTHCCWQSLRLTFLLNTDFFRSLTVDFFQVTSWDVTVVGTLSLKIHGSVVLPWQTMGIPFALLTPLGPGQLSPMFKFLSRWLLIRCRRICVNVSVAITNRTTAPVVQRFLWTLSMNWHVRESGTSKRHKSTCETLMLWNSTSSPRILDSFLCFFNALKFDELTSNPR